MTDSDTVAHYGDKADKVELLHPVHRKCIKAWMDFISTCPTCRFPLTWQEDVPLTWQEDAIQRQEDAIQIRYIGYDEKAKKKLRKAAEGIIGALAVSTFLAIPMTVGQVIGGAIGGQLGAVQGSLYGIAVGGVAVIWTGLKLVEYVEY